jgi:TonB family protein
MRYIVPFSLLSALACSAPVARQAALPRADTSRVFLDTMRRDMAAVYAEAVVDSPPRIIRCPPADYPPAARDAGIQGRVTLQFVIDTLGRPEAGSVRAVESPNDSLSSAAVRAMLGCEFTPARVRGRAVRVLVRIPYDFHITR